MTSTEDFLEHYGVKGMKWGQRLADSKFGKASQKNAANAKKRTAAGVAVGSTVGGGNWARKRAAKQEHKAWKKQASSSETANKVFQEAIKTSKPAFNRINNEPQFKGKDLTKDYALAREYDRKVSQTFNDHMVTASMKLASNKAGDRVMVYQFDRNVGMMRATEMKRVDEVEHADTEGYPDFRAVLNDLGHIVDLVPADDEDPFVQQSDAAVDFLAHYGVKGMKWGVRKANGRLDPKATTTSLVNEAKGRIQKEVAERSSTEITVRTKPGSMVRVVGGNRRDPHADAINARVAEQIAKRNTLDALSNKDLQQLVTRMNLEQQYRNLATKEDRMSAGEKLIRKVIQDKGDAVFNKLGPAASITKSVVDSRLKNSNKALLGGKPGKDKKDKDS